MTFLRSIAAIAFAAACFAPTLGQITGMTQLPGKAKDIDAGAYNSVWRIGNDSSISRFENGGWTKIDGTAERVAVDSFGFPWVVKSTGEILRRNGRTWITLPGNAADIDIGDNGDIWIVGRDGWLRRWGGVDWIDAVKTDAMRVAVNGQGVPWIMTSKGQLLIADFAAKFSGAAKAVATGSDGSLWLIAPDLSIFRWTSEKEWEQEIKGKFAEISVAPDGKLYVVDASGNIFHSNQ